MIRGPEAQFKCWPAVLFGWPGMSRVQEFKYLNFVKKDTICKPIMDSTLARDVLMTWSAGESDRPPPELYDIFLEKVLPFHSFLHFFPLGLMRNSKPSNCVWCERSIILFWNLSKICATRLSANVLALSSQSVTLYQSTAIHFLNLLIAFGIRVLLEPIPITVGQRLGTTWMVHQFRHRAT